MDETRDPDDPYGAPDEIAGEANRVERPRMADGATPPSQSSADPTVAPPGTFASVTPHVNTVAAASTPAWKTWAVPVAAAAVLLGGAGLLMFRGGGDPSVTSDPGTTETASTDEPNDPDEPTVASTTPSGSDPSLPMITPPPLIEPPSTAATDPSPPVTAADDTTPITAAPPEGDITPVAGPTTEEVRSALITLDDLEDTDWRPDTFGESAAPCGVNPDDAARTQVERVVYSRITVTEPVAIRQITHLIVSFPDEATAIRAFETDVELLNECSGQTVNVSGVDYDVAVTSSAYTPEESAAFPCADDNAFFITTLTSDDENLPFLAEASSSFRCGVNVTVIGFVTTLTISDLDDPDFYTANAVSNSQVAALRGSS